MSSTNMVVATGHLGADPELRYVPSGTAVCELRLCIDNTYKNSSGEVVDDTCWITASVWGKQGENCQKYLAKGSHVLIEGSLREDKWEKDGQKRSAIRLRAFRVQFLDKPEGADRPAGDEPDGTAQVNDDAPDDLPW